MICLIRFAIGRSTIGEYGTIENAYASAKAHFAQDSRNRMNLEGTRIHWHSACLRERFGQPVWRLGIDAGFTCPHRSADRLLGGCRFCAPDGNISAYQKSKRELPVLEAQIARALEFTARRYGAKAFFLYFQAYTCTNAPADTLRRIYDEAIDAFARASEGLYETRGPSLPPQIAERLRIAPHALKGIIVGTRPDCFDAAKAALLAEYAVRGFEMWVEFGLQSSHDPTLSFIKRNHDAQSYRTAMEIARRAGLRRTTHLMLGLPEESREMMVESARAAASTETEGVKFHDFRIARGSAFARSFMAGEIVQMHPSRLPALLADCLEAMPPATEIMRLSSDFRPEECIDLHPPLDKHVLAQLVEEELARRNSWQGRCFNIPSRTL